MGHETLRPVPTFVRSIVIAAPQAALFDLMQDYERRLTWDPFLSEARLVDAKVAGLGVRSWCVDHRGRGMETEYVSFDRPAKVAVKMTKGPWMFTRFAGSWGYEKLEERSTKVTFRYHVEAPFGQVGDWVLEKVFAREMDARLGALKSAVESGRVAI